MKTLVKYEFLKILRRRSTMIVMAISLLITAFLFGLPIIQYQTYNQEGVIKGKDGIAYNKEQYKGLSVALTETYITDTIREYQKLFENPDHVGYDGNERYLIGDAYWNFVAPREKLLDVIGVNYDNPGEYSGFNKLQDLDLSRGTNFYETREQKIEMILNTPSRKLSEEQKEYWRNINSQVKIPYQYGYYEGWGIIVSSFELFMFAILAVCIVIAPVFSGEYQAGTDAVILSSKYGKTKLITAKIIASVLLGLLAFTIHVIVACGLPLAAFGIDGWNLPVQIANTAIPYPFTLVEAVLIEFVVIYLMLLALISLTLLLSARMKNTYLVLAVLVFVLFIPMFLVPNSTVGAYNLLLFLSPYRSTMPELSKYISYQLGGLVLDVLSVRTILYAVLTIILLPLSRLGFKKHQIMA